MVDQTDPQLSMSAEIYQQYPWLKMYYVDDLIGSAQKALEVAKLKCPTDLYSIPSFLAECENGLKLLRKDRASHNYEGFEDDEELNNIEKNLERLVNELREITETEKCDLVEEIKQQQLNLPGSSSEVEQLENLEIAE